MMCNACGQRVKDGARFCENCGNALQAPGRVMRHTPIGGIGSSVDPYKDRISHLKLQIKELKLDLRQITNSMSSTRAQYNQTSAFVPHGLLKHGYKWVEDFRLWGPQQQKQRLQQEIMNLEQELLGLQKAQIQWKDQN